MTECYKIGEFVDASGKVRKFVACGIIVEQQDELMLASILPAEAVGIPAEGKACIPVVESNGDGHILSGIFFGVAVCSPIDQFDLEKGKEIAKRHALNGKSHQRWIHTDFPPIFSDKVLDVVTAEWVNQIKAHPESLAPGYYRNVVHDEYNKLSRDERRIVRALQHPEQYDMVKLRDIAKRLNSLQQRHS